MSASETIPHCYPFRLIERLSREEDGSRVAIVLASANGTLLRGQPWPVTLVAEALAQAILLIARPGPQAELRLVGMNKVAMFQPMAAGDRLEVGVEEVGSYPPLRRYSCRARRAGALAAVAEITVSG
ncbi:MAG: hypothetical protein V1750_00155 [Acidobacteriota bacterium]